MGRHRRLEGFDVKWLCGEQEIEVQPDPDVTTRVLPGGDIEVQVGDRVVIVSRATGERGEVYLGLGGRTWKFQPAQSLRTAVRRQKSGSLSAPMTGIVGAVHVAVGDIVEAYQPLAVLEAMKVMATLEAPFAGTVTAVHASPGDRVEHGAVLVEMEKT